MEGVNDATPRLTPEEADARAAALIAQYRSETQGSRRQRSPTISPALGWVVVYLLGVVGGAIWHARPIVAVLVGVPLVWIGRAFVNRRRSATTAETP